eukprot:Rhum_TRINITY_DN14099_c1_g1::Rhum_TRINITY_DN14099_c1_g1_i2::g.67699::m.67699
MVPSRRVALSTFCWMRVATSSLHSSCVDESAPPPPPPLLLPLGDQSPLPSKASPAGLRSLLYHSFSRRDSCSFFTVCLSESRSCFSSVLSFCSMRNASFSECSPSRSRSISATFRFSASFSLRSCAMSSPSVPPLRPTGGCTCGAAGGDACCCCCCCCGSHFGPALNSDPPRHGGDPHMPSSPPPPLPALPVPLAKASMFRELTTLDASESAAPLLPPCAASSLCHRVDSRLPIWLSKPPTQPRSGEAATAAAAAATASPRDSGFESRLARSVGGPPSGDRSLLQLEGGSSTAEADTEADASSGASHLPSSAASSGVGASRRSDASASRALRLSSAASAAAAATAAAASASCTARSFASRRSCSSRRRCCSCCCCCCCCCSSCCCCCCCCSCCRCCSS